jgi:CelD/BcsL family acetyltransferase involved in cellulose biosynthesis
LVLLRIREILREVNRILRLVLRREIPEDPELRRQWNALVQGMEQPQVFYTYEWGLAVQRAYGETLRPLLFLAYDSKESLCGVAALAVDAIGRKVSFLCATTGDYCDFLSSPVDRDSLVAMVLGELRKQGFEEISLTNLPADSATAEALRKRSAKNGYQHFARTAYECAQVSLARLERRQGEKQPVLPRKKMLRRFLNAMGRETPVRLDHARSWDAIAPVLPEFIQAHIARFLVTGRISNMARPERRVFLEELAKLLSQSGWVALTRMMSGTRAFAWNYGFQFHGTWFWYQPTFDSDLEKYSPGFCLLAKLVEEAAEDSSMQTVDLGLGAEEYKERFANQIRETLYVTLRASLFQHGREILRFRAAQAIQAQPKLEVMFRKGIQYLQKFRQNARTKGVPRAIGEMAKRVGAILRSDTEVFFFDGCHFEVTGALETEIHPIDLRLLALAASTYVDDQLTLEYLLRSASRSRDGGCEGFALVNAAGTPLHFAWATAFDGFFLSELNAKVDSPSAEAVMLFDCWTPVAERGHGYYGRTVGLISRRMLEKGKQPWIFSATANAASIRGLQKAGFRQRYSLVRRRFLGMQTIVGAPPKFMETPSREVSARV